MKRCICHDFIDTLNATKIVRVTCRSINACSLLFYYWVFTSMGLLINITSVKKEERLKQAWGWVGRMTCGTYPGQITKSSSVCVMLCLPDCESIDSHCKSLVQASEISLYGTKGRGKWWFILRFMLSSGNIFFPEKFPPLIMLVWAVCRSIDKSLSLQSIG